MKRKIIRVLFCILFLIGNTVPVLAAHYDGTGWVSDMPKHDPSDPYVGTMPEEEIEKYKNKIKDKIEGVEGEDEKNSAGTGEEGNEKAPSESESSQQESDGQKQTAENAGESESALDGKAETTGGDPVKLSQGAYVQEETDLLIDSKMEFTISRNYSSGANVAASIGYGWNTNIDERIIFGVDSGIPQIVNALTSYVNQQKGYINRLAELYRRKYAVSDIYNATNEIKAKIAKCDSNLSEIESIKSEISEIKGMSGASALVSPMNNFDKQADELRKKIENKKKVLNSRLNYVSSDIQKMNVENSKLNSAQAKLSVYKAKLEKLQNIKNKNTKAMFPGMGPMYDETGFNTITIIDEKGYPHLMYETSDGSGVWKNKEDSQYLVCQKNGDGLKVTQTNCVLKEYDSYGFIVKITDLNGNFVELVRTTDEKIELVRTSGGEQFSFEYENNKITKITNDRDPSQNIIYTYSGNKLTAVRDTDGDTVTMTYDSNGLMTSLNKCDGKTVTFTYGEVDSKGKILATATTNEEGFTEYFDYDRSGKKTTYTDHDGNKTVYEYDEHHRTLQQINSDGTVIKNTYSGKNLTRVEENGLATTFEYDERGNKIKANYADGSTEDWKYNSYNQVTAYTDRDGVVQEYIRDEKGNLTTYKTGGQTVFTEEYDSRGFVIRKIEYADREVVTTYEYDDFGNLICKTCGNENTLYEYDAQNRVVKVKCGGKIISEYSYTSKTTKRSDYNGLETVWETNGRKDLVQVTQKDNATGKEIKTRIVYDGRHLPVQVFAGIQEGGENASELLQTGYAYTPEGKIYAQVSYACADGNNFVRLYSYKNGQIESVKQFIVKEELPQDLSGVDFNTLVQSAGKNVYIQKYDYTKLGQNREKLTVTDGNGNTNLFEYDSFGNLVKITDGNGEESKRSYTKGGRLASEQSAHGGWFNYGYGSGGELVRAGEEGGEAVTVVYNPNGSVSTKTDRYGKSVLYSYDSCGRVSSVRSENATTWYTYDSFGRVIKAVTGNSPYEQNCSYYVTYEYSDDGRSIKVLEGGKYSSTMQLDAFGNVICQIDGNGNKTKYEYDLQNRVVAKFDGYGNKTSYEYGANVGVTKVTGADLNATIYEYNYMGKISRVTDGEGVVYSASYDAGGRLIKEKRRADAEKSYEYDKAGRVVKVLCGGEVVESYEYSPKGRTITVKDGNGSDYIYNYDGFGRLTDEKNRIGDVKQYFYDSEGSVKSQYNFDGGTTVIEYSGNRLTKTVRYSDGSENIFEYDATGNIIRAKNDYGITEYKYDLAGQLVWQKDVTTGEEVYFEYDAAKNRTKLYSTNRETVYSYGKNNEVLEVYDNKQRMSVSLKYDVCGREVERKFANGVVQKTAYDKAGRVVLITQKAGRDITWAEGYVYGEDGKRTATVDNAGRVTMYEYNQKGQLSKVYYPYTESMKQKLSSEVEENGLPTVADVGVNKFLSSDMYTKLGSLMNKINMTWSGKITSVQIFIPESYTYDKNGNRITKTTPFGTISYAYDSENRLVSTGSNGKTVVNYTYDKNGNLLSKESALKSEKYSYNSQNRLCESVVIDRQNKTQAVSYYGYDAFGRRVVVQDRDEACMRSLYDGFTFDVIKQSPTLANGMFVDSNETGLRLNRTGKATGDRYRYLDDDKNDGNRYFYLDDGNYKSVRSRYVGERTSITVNGVVAAQNAGGEVSYFTTDLLGSVRSTTDSTGFGTNSYTYDVFGSLVEGELSGATDYGYLDKQFDPQTGLYNYGYRDYAPGVARFTTVDPIRDGENWFSYVNNDPVNFVDLWGLSAVDKQTAYDESDVHCDIYAWNGALDNGKDPRGQNGETPDLNNTTVTEFYKLFPDNRNSTPPDNTKGYMFYDNTKDGVDNPTHVEFYDNTNSNANTFIENKTGGITPPVRTEREMNDERNINWTFVPLPDL